MIRDSVIAAVDEAFGVATRPSQFISGTCDCEECLEHEATLQRFDPRSLPLAELANPMWDPICFATPQAYMYLIPGMARLVLNHPAEYIDQFAFHLHQPDRLSQFSPDQAQSLLALLELLELEELATIYNHLGKEDFFGLRKLLHDVATHDTDRPVPNPE